MADWCFERRGQLLLECTAADALTTANKAREFLTKLCRYPKTNPTKPEDIRIKRESEAAIVEPQRHILEAHAERLTAELAARNDEIAAWS